MSCPLLCVSVHIDPFERSVFIQGIITPDDECIFIIRFPSVNGNLIRAIATVIKMIDVIERSRRIIRRGFQHHIDRCGIAGDGVNQVGILMVGEVSCPFYYVALADSDRFATIERRDEVIRSMDNRVGSFGGQQGVDKHGILSYYRLTVHGGISVTTGYLAV